MAGVTVLEGTNNIVLLGSYTQSVGHLTGRMSVPANNDGFYLARLNDDGSEMWTEFGYTESMGLAGVTSDVDDIVFAGNGLAAVNAGGMEVALLPNDAFFVPSDHGGSISIPTVYSDSGAQVPLDVAAGVGANFAVAGYFTTGIDLGGGLSLGELTMAEEAGFAGVVDKTGVAQWLTGVRGPGNQRIRAVTVRLGNVIVAGTTNQSTTIQASAGGNSVDLTISEPGAPKVFWAELDDETGIPSAGGTFAGTGNQHVHGLAAAGGDGFLAVGYHNGELNIPGIASASATGMRDGYAAMVHPSDPASQWLTRLEGPLQQEITAAAVRSPAEIVIGGFYEGAATLRSADFDLALPDSTSNVQDMFVAGLDRTTGDPLWVVSLHSPENADVLEDLVVDALGRVVVGGTFSGALTFGNRTTGGTTSGLGGFVTRFDPATLP